MIDRFTRWPEAVPITDITADTVVAAFFATWIARYGAPITITTDRGAQFESAFFQALTNFIGCERIRTIAYHPASNGMVERWHRSLKSAIMCHETAQWVDTLPIVLLGLRTSLKEDINSSAAKLVFGTTLRIPGEFLVDSNNLPSTNLRRKFTPTHARYLTDFDGASQQKETFHSQDVVHVLTRIPENHWGKEIARSTIRRTA